MEISVLASGSSGNSTFISGDESAVLVDAGVSLRQITKSLSNIGKDLKDIDAILVTHEHIDHIKGLEKAARHARVLMNRGTYGSIHMDIKPDIFRYDDPFVIGDLEIISRKTSHDAAMPTGFEISCKKKKVGYFTDLGRYDDALKKITSVADCMVLEANHDIDMLLGGRYPYHLKQRILGDMGHLSNIDAGILVRDHGSERLKNVFLAHLSKNNNTPELASGTFASIVEKNHDLKVRKTITSDHMQTDLLRF
jgi:phosphoribosyl 1,2-cyclic phosphodiesterase